ncbi:hypothetical protein Moror_2489, partial [Moniliophthora roreri MCA 2997]
KMYRKAANTFPEGPEHNTEIQCRVKYETDARTRIGNWSRHHWAAKKTDCDMVSQVLQTMLQLMNTRPCKVPVVQCYQQDFWDTHLKRSFEDHWAKANLPLKYLLSECNQYASLMFNKESEAFMKELTEKNDKEYAAQMAAYCNRSSWSGNAATYSAAWKKVHHMAPTLADVLAQLFSVGCTVVLYGPQDDGNIDITSIDDVVPESASKAKNSDDFDPKRMAEMKDFFHAYATDMFTEAVCQSRVYDEEMDNEAGDDKAEDKEKSRPSTAIDPSPVSPNPASPTPTIATSPSAPTTTSINNANAPAVLPAATTAASKDCGLDSPEEEDNRAPRKAPDRPVTPSPPSNNTPISSAVVNGQARSQFVHSNPTTTTLTSASGFIFPDINSEVTADAMNAQNGGGLRLWDELHGDPQVGWGGIAGERASGGMMGPNFADYNLAQSLNGSWFDSAQNLNPQLSFNQQSFVFQQGQFPHQQPFYPQLSSLLDQPSFPQQTQSSFDHRQHLVHPQQTPAQPAFHQQPNPTPQQAPQPIDHALAPATHAHNVPAGHASSLPSMPLSPSVPSTSPSPPSSDTPASSATLPIIPPALPTTNQIPEKENDPNVQPKMGRKQKCPEPNSNQVAAGGEVSTERSKHPWVLTEKMAIGKQNEEDKKKAAQKAKKKQGGPAPRKASATAKRKSTTKK